MNEGVPDDSIVHYIVIDGIRIRSVIAHKHTRVNERRTVPNIDQITGNVRVQTAIDQLNITVFGIHRIAKIPGQRDVVKGDGGKPSRNRRAVVNRVIAFRCPLDYGMTDDIAFRRSIKLNVSPRCFAVGIESKSDGCIGRPFGEQLTTNQETGIGWKPNFHAWFQCERSASLDHTRTRSEVRGTIGRER